MKLKHIIAATTVAASTLILTHNSHAGGFAVEARSLAMGNASVATADIATAALANPAMLAQQKAEDDFALLLPSVGVFIDDSDGLIDLVDQFQLDSDACIVSGNPASAACTAVQTSFAALPGKALSPRVSAGVALGVAGETLSFAISVRSDIAFAGGVDGASVDTTIPGLQDPNKNLMVLRGVQTTEVGVSLAGNVELMGLKLSLGVTPKVVSVESLVLSESAATLNTGASSLVDENLVVDLGSFTTLDAGLMVGLTDNIRLGVVARNLISDGFTDSSNTALGPVAINFDTQLRAGVAYNGDTVTIGADLDLTENDPVINTFGAQKTRMLSVGAELDILEIAQLRVGLQKNLASGANSDALLTAGVGLSFGVHIDIAAIAGNDTFGAYLQTGFRF